MSEFYRQLSQPDVTIKAEALRRAQITMLRGQLRLEEGELRGPGFRAQSLCRLRWKEILISPIPTTGQLSR
jgi:CHAT domain-containing protein